MRKFIFHPGLIGLVVFSSSCIAVAPHAPPASGVELLRLVKTLIDAGGLSNSAEIARALHADRETMATTISCGRRSYPDGGMRVQALHPSWFQASEGGSRSAFKVASSKLKPSRGATITPSIIYRVRDDRCRERREPPPGQAAGLDFLNVDAFACITDADVARVMPDVGPPRGYVDAVPDFVYGPHIIAGTSIRAVFWSAPNYDADVKRDCLGSIEILEF